MADNFLEKRQEAYKIQISGRVQRKPGADIQQLLLKCAANVQYNGSYVVRDDQLNGLVAAAALVGDSDSFSFSVSVGDEAENFLNDLSCEMPAAACVTIQSNEGDAPTVFVRLGMMLQAMMLRAAEMGLHAHIVECGVCDGRASAVLAVGRPDCK